MNININGVHKIFFLHFNKTGGTSLYRFLESMYDPKCYIPDDRVLEFQHGKFDRRDFILKLSKFNLITKLHLNSSYLRDLRKLQPSFKAVCVFRNPKERVFSQIEAWRRVPDEILKTLDAQRLNLMLDARQMSATEFIEKHWMRLSNKQSKMTAGLETNTDLPEQRILETAIEILETIEFVGLTHRLDQLAASIAWKLGRYNCYNDEKLNVTRGGQKLSDCEKESIKDHVLALNSVDIPLFQIAERKAFNLISDTYFSQFLSSNQSKNLMPISSERSFTQCMSDTLQGTGWHERERGLDGPARWGGPQRFSSLYFSIIPDLPFTINIKIISILQSDALNTLKVWVNDDLIETHIETVNGFPLIITEICRPDPSRNNIKLVLENNIVCKAFELYGVEDHRSKTVAIESVTLSSIHGVV